MDFARITLRISSGVIVWGLHFGVVYGITALACARGWPGLVPWTIGVATLVALAATLAIVAREWPRRQAFEAWLAATIAALAAVGIAYEGLPVLILPVCR